MTQVIGISGCTSSGKTTLTKLLLLYFDKSTSVSQDDFYFSRYSGQVEYLPELRTYNFDSPQAIDFKRLNSSLVHLIEENKYQFIFVDGSLIYSNDELCELINKKYFIVLNKEECLRRRLTRTYLSTDPGDYFEKCAWPEYLKYRESCLNKHNDIVYLDGSRLVEENLELLIDDITSHVDWVLL